MEVVELVERVSGVSQTDFAARVRKGERSALREVYERTHQRLYRFALAMTGNADEAGDAPADAPFDGATDAPGDALGDALDAVGDATEGG